MEHSEAVLPARRQPPGTAGRPRGGRVLVLLMAAHPAPAFAVTGMASALAVAAGRDAGGCLLAGFAVLSGQLCIGWSNDRIDLARDVAARRGDKPLATGALAPRTAAWAAGGAGAACVPLSLANGLAAGGVHLAAVAAGLAYNAALKRTRWSWVPYAFAFGLLPAFVTLGLPDHPWPPFWLASAGALLGVGAHFSNVLPDIDADLACGVRGLPQRLGRRWSGVLSALALAGATADLTLAPPGTPGPLGWTGLGAAVVLLGLGAAAAGRAGSRSPFLLTIALSALDLALLLARGAARR